MRVRTLALAAGIACFSVAAAHADPIEGQWRTQSGSTAQIAPCGGGFCVTMKSGEHAGKRIGKMSPAGENRYTGEITDPATDETYSGKASISGATLKMSGCVLGGLFCRSQNWKRM
ncbi:MAG TPA: DUF2147 domain-containing protein [Mesorhizobium sp.]|jgi:uncharacterized protein (DUF2147 family)|nr:DUF2147 domain-containing protein [Mesorhizobium sp.]